MALFSRKNINNDPINELRGRIDTFIAGLVAGEDNLLYKRELIKSLKKDNYQLAKEIYDIIHYSKEESSNKTYNDEEESL